MKVPDRIEKRIVLKARLERVWRAISDSQEFGEWFGVAFDGPFVAGERATGKMRATRVDPEIAKIQEPYAGMKFEIEVESMEAPHRFAFRWHPYAIEPNVDYSAEPTTLVTFELKAVEGGTELVITESGFDRIPLERRAQAFTSNEEGWGLQATLVEKYLSGHAAG